MANSIMSLAPSWILFPTPALPAPCRFRPRFVAAASVSATPQVQHPLASDKNAAWKDFAEHISGEWDGYGAEFSATGVPCELPSSVVPDAFQEWDVQIHDWQTQCPTLADKSLQYKLIRLLPTVGCEADAATQYSMDERHAEDPDSGVEFLAFHISGSYIAVWPGRRVMKERLGRGNPSKFFAHEGDKQSTFEVEHCLLQGGDTRFRVRLLQQIVIQGPFEHGRTIPVIKRITVQREKWESDFRDGDLLGGCATTGSAFAATNPLQVSGLAGTWQLNKFTTEPGIHPVIHQLTHEVSEIERREAPKDALPLPKGLWSEMKVMEDGGFSLGAGWLINVDTAITSNCEFFSNGKIKEYDWIYSNLTKVYIYFWNDDDYLGLSNDYYARPFCKLCGAFPG